MFMVRLKELREEKGMNQREFAADFGVSPATVGMWESGAREPRTLEQLQRIADYFHVTVDYLLGNVNEPWFYLDNEKTLRDINSYETEPNLNQQLSGIDFALSGEIHDLTDAEKQDILDYIRFKKSQRGGDKK